ncbi:MAG: hypothetical protein ACI9RU_001028 [Litorivivens sp.]|jgi:hypothetical protein
MKKILLFPLLVFVCSLTAQQHVGCGFDLLLESEKDGKAVRWNEAYRYALERHMDEQRADEIIQIPVVFHIVWNQDYQNLHDSVIFSQLDVLNEDYRRMNADADLTRDEFLDVAADAEIEFFLAEVDPEGNLTNGIDRVESAVSGFQLDFFDFSTLDAVKSSETNGADAWDTDHYLNIWVCNLEESLFGQIFGYAYPPEGAPNWPEGTSAPSPGLEGVVLHYATVGRNNPQGMDDNLEGNERGRTATHEIGHYLGLRHIWADGFFDGCAEDDGLEDTPNAATSANFVCDYSNNTCDDGEGDLPDMIENYMDYNQGECYNMFTYEQINMMRTNIELFRPGLLEEVGVAVEEQKPVTVTVAPNPVGGKLTVRGNWKESAELSLHDLSGRLVYQVVSKSNLIEIETNFLERGIYILRVDGLGETKIVKK